jgi:TRAP-type C4-dicarboxylate transport system substrate-binding protein
MMDIKFAPVVGATIITKKAWDSIDPSLRPTLLKLALETGAEFTPQIRKLETDAIDAMVKNGLQIQKLTPQAEQEWQQTAEKFYPKIRGTIVPADLFDEVKRLVMEYRAQKKAEPVKTPEPVKKLEPAKTPPPVKKK